jgi:hypothetical protein
LSFFEAVGDSFGHFFNPYISLHLEDFDFFPNAFSIASIVIPCSEVFIFVAPLTCDPCFHSNLDVSSSASSPLIQVNVPSSYEIVERTDYESHVKELIPKF